MDVNSLRCQNDLNLTNDLQINGFFKTKIALPNHWQSLVEEHNWQHLDHELHHFTDPKSNSSLVLLLKEFCDFDSIEFIISIRDAKNNWEEDGIWHDDGSRKLAFSLSLTLMPEKIEGGVLEIRKKGDSKSQKIPPFAYAEVVVFATGSSGFEHKINKVTLGQRIIIAGWCS